MEFTFGLDQIISYLVTIISLVLFILERKKNKNSKLPIYMTIQGLMRNMLQKSQVYAFIVGSIEDREKRGVKEIPLEEYKMVANIAYSDMASFMELTMGQLKAIEPHDDLPFDPKDFLNQIDSKNKSDAARKEK